jgi:hypothetical protein
VFKAGLGLKDGEYRSKVESICWAEQGSEEFQTSDRDDERYFLHAGIKN